MAIMKTFCKALAISALLLVPASAAHAQVSFGITIGPPPQLRTSHVAPQLRQEDVWVDGYWYPVGSKYVWHAGYWTAPPYSGAYWNEPYHNGTQYVPGYWDGDHGRADHDHHSDRNKHRDGRGNDRH
jgi:hypothetical protein